MTDIPSRQELFRIARDEILAHNSRLKRDVIERDGTDANAIVAAISGVGDEISLTMARICAAQFLSSARGQPLRRVVFDRYGLVEVPAGAALTTVQFSTTAGAPVTFSIPKDTKVQTNDGRQFVTIVAATYLAGSTGPLSVPVRSVLAGLSQQVRAGSITAIVDTLQNAPADLRVTNGLATSGGANSEEDDDLRSRAQAFWTTVQKGTRAAVVADARAVPGVKRAEGVEIVDELGRPVRGQLIIADQFTDALVSETTPPAYETQSQSLAAQVSLELEDTRAFGVAVDVLVGQVVLQSVILALNFAAGAAIDVAALRARAACVNYINGLNPGATLDPVALIAVLRLVPGLVVTGSEILSPPAPVVPATLQVLRTSLSLVTAVSTTSDRVLQSSNPDVGVV